MRVIINSCIKKKCIPCCFSIGREQEKQRLVLKEKKKRSSNIFSIQYSIFFSLLVLEIIFQCAH